jgi:hypothetical protein
MKTLRLYKFSVEILDEAELSDADFAIEVAKALSIHMEARRTEVKLTEASDIQVNLDEFGRPILAEA